MCIMRIFESTVCMHVCMYASSVLEYMYVCIEIMYVYYVYIGYILTFINN
jgi:hypothetical protein